MRRIAPAVALLLPAAAAVAQLPIALARASLGPTVGAADFGTMSLDDLIGRLPSVKAEGRYDEGKREWVAHPAVDEMSRRLKAGVSLSPSQWQRALTRTHIIQFRPRWPATETYLVTMQDSAWLRLCEIELKPEQAGQQVLKGGTTFWEMCGNGAAWREREQMRQPLALLPRGRHHLVFAATIRRGTSSIFAGDAGPAGVVWTGPLSFDVEIVPTLDEAVAPVDAPKINDAIRESLGLTIRPWGDGGKAALLVLDVDTGRFPDLATLGISADVKVDRDGVPKGSARLVVHAYDALLSSNSVYDSTPQVFSFTGLDGLPLNEPPDSPEWAHWAVTINGTDRDVLSLFHADRRWAGWVKLSLSDAIRQEVARTAGKGDRMFVWMP